MRRANLACDDDFFAYAEMLARAGYACSQQRCVRI
jgi:hypothetical protein